MYDPALNDKPSQKEREREREIYKELLRRKPLKLRAGSMIKMEQKQGERIVEENLFQTPCNIHILKQSLSGSVLNSVLYSRAKERQIIIEENTYRTPWKIRTLNDKESQR